MTLSPAWTDYKDRANEVPLLTAARQVGAQLKRAGAEWVGPCPACGGRDRLGINPGKQKWVCRGAEGGSTAIGIAMHCGKLSFGEACQLLTGDQPPSGHTKPLSDAELAERDRRRAENDAHQERLKAQQAAYQEDTQEAAFSIWMASKPMLGSMAEKYLNGRGIPTPAKGWHPVLRFHPSLPYPERGSHPALVARVDDVGGEFTAIWRVYLTADGRKLDVEFPKLGLGPAGGGAVRLGGLGPHIGLCEGIETAFGVMMLNALGNLNYPIWATLSTAGLVGIELPLGVSRATLFPDSDIPMRRQDGEYVPCDAAPGMKAATALRDRLRGEGITCSIAALPGPGLDYLDLWNSQALEVA
jgi:putative DNA primase/helicase